MHIVLAGGTGLVGGAVLDAALANGTRVTTVGRRPTDRVDGEIVTDFREPLELPQADAALCALGTTIAAAGSKEAFRAVDHDAVITFAKAAHRAGIEHFLIVSAVGASTRARVFYSKVKGQAEQALETLGFARVDIAQPGLLLGPREEHRPVEALLQGLNPIFRRSMIGPLDRYSGIEARVVADALLALCACGEPGVYRHENRAMRDLANSNR